MLTSLSLSAPFPILSVSTSVSPIRPVAILAITVHFTPKKRLVVHQVSLNLHIDVHIVDFTYWTLVDTSVEELGSSIFDTGVTRIP